MRPHLLPPSSFEPGVAAVAAAAVVVVAAVAAVVAAAVFEGVGPAQPFVVV